MRVTLKAPNGPVTLDLVNLRDHISRVIAKNRNWYEIDLLTDLRSRTPLGTAVDVGAHIGNHSLYLANAGFDVVSLEPNPYVLTQLRRNVANNNANVKVLPFAAGAEEGRGTVHSPNPENSGMAFVETDHLGDVEVVALDSLGLTNVTVIKIDVEGHEMDVLNGAWVTIDTYKPVMYIEASTDEARKRVDDFLLPLGYVMVGRFAKTPTYCYVPKPEAATLSLTIMAHPQRTDMALKLAKEIGLQGQANTIVWDERNDRWDTGRRSMLNNDATKTHHLVLQDDAVIPRNFIELVNQAIQVPPPDSPLCLYIGKALRRRMVGVLPSWYTMPGVNWGVGIIVPTGVIGEMVLFGNTRQEDNYDLRLSRFFQSKKILTWYPVPSLVNHRHTPSLVAGRGSRRTAARYVGQEGAQFNPHGAVQHIKWSR